MHLKSENGPIDVLVCPEDDPQCLQSPPNGLGNSLKSSYSSEVDCTSSLAITSSAELIPQPLPPSHPGQPLPHQQHHPPQPSTSSLHGTTTTQLLHQQQQLQQHQFSQQSLQDQQQQHLLQQQQQQQCLHSVSTASTASIPPSSKLEDCCLRQHDTQAGIDGLSVNRTVTATPHHTYPQVAVSAPNELDISLSSAADVGDDLGFMDRLLPLDMFDHLSPTLNTTEDFSFSLDGDNEGIQDLFDI